MKYFYMVLATAFGLSFAWSVATAKDRAVETSTAKTRQEQKQRQPVCKTEQRGKTGSRRLRSTCSKAAVGKSATTYEWIEADKGFILVKHAMTPVSPFE